MLARVDPGPELLALAAAQGDVISAGQAELLGVGRHSRSRLQTSGRWQRLEGPVYSTRPGPPTFEGLAWAGILLGGPRARLGGEAAAHLHGLTPDPPRSLEVLVPPTSRGSSRPPWVFRREQPGFRSPRSPGQPPRLTLEHTVLDLCDGAGVREVVGWVTQAVQTRRTTVVRLRRALEGRSRHSRRQLLDELLGDVGLGVESPLELRYLRDVERAHGLPQGNRRTCRGTATGVMSSLWSIGWWLSWTVGWDTTGWAGSATCDATTTPPSTVR